MAAIVASQTRAEEQYRTLVNTAISALYSDTFNRVVYVGYSNYCSTAYNKDCWSYTRYFQRNAVHRDLK